MKKFASFCMAIFLVLSISGCGASPVSTTSANIAPATETKTIEPVKVDPAVSVASPAVASDGVVNATTVLTGKKLKVSYIDVGQADAGSERRRTSIPELPEFT